MSRLTAHLVLSDGTTFEGLAGGYDAPSGIATGEFVFNTAMSGYQEVITDPSYAGQVIVFTSPHIGNYGVTPRDDESSRAWCRGVVMRDLSAVASNWSSHGTLENFLVQQRISAMTDIDTRRLTRHLRSRGALAGAFGPAPLEELSRAAASAVGTDGCDLVRDVTTTKPYTVGDGPLHIVAYDYGVKTTMIRQLAQRFFVTVVPAATTSDEIDALAPDGVFLSNGPGDPAALTQHVAVIEKLIGRYPLFGICLGHQLLATALGATTHKLPFGHHGSNHPVQDVATGKIEITAQNHNYAVVADSLGRAVVSHINLNDGVIEGISAPQERCFSVQYHPEAGPGPHDARYLFERFSALMSPSQVGVK